MPIEHTKPSELTDFAPKLFINDHINHGRGIPTVTSKMFDPIDDETAISPCPSLATITEVIKSGTDVPAAKHVKPINAESIFQVSPILVAHQTIKYEKNDIHIIDMKNEIMKMY